MSAFYRKIALRLCRFHFHWPQWKFRHFAVVLCPNLGSQSHPPSHRQFQSRCDGSEIESEFHLHMVKGLLGNAEIVKRSAARATEFPELHNLPLHTPSARGDYFRKFRTKREFISSPLGIDMPYFSKEMTDLKEKKKEEAFQLFLETMLHASLWLGWKLDGIDCFYSTSFTNSLFLYIRV